MRARCRASISWQVLAASVFVVIAGAAALRNADLVVNATGGHVRVAIDGAAYVAFMQLATLSGVVCAALWSSLGYAQDCEYGAADLVRSRFRDASGLWWLDLILVFSSIAATAFALLLALVAACSLSALRLGGSVPEYTFDITRFFTALGHALPVWFLFATVTVAASAGLRGARTNVLLVPPAVTVCLLALQYLAGSLGDQVVPTSWVGRWLHLPAAQQGAAYFWTSGGFASGRDLAGVAIVATGLLAGYLGRRAFR
jgi:hypothetical protein